jgi:hypothetical protein
MKNKVAAPVVVFLLCAAASFADTFTGVITDTMCGAKAHSMMMKGKPDAECVKACAKGPHQYALLSGTNVMKLSDQKSAAKYPAEKVTVMGTYDDKTKTIKVASIEPTDSK